MGVGWAIAYIAAISIGVRERCWCIPASAIYFNCAWELWSVIDRVCSGVAYDWSFFIPLVWLVLDAGIFVTLLLYGHNGGFYWGALFWLLAFVLLSGAVFNKGESFLVSAFLSNVWMSVAFIWNCVRGIGQRASRLIAISKMLGTLCATLLEGVMYRNLLVLYLGGVCFLLDLYYLILLIRYGRKASV